MTSEEAVTCTSCGTQNAVARMFCSNCGGQLGERQGPVRVTPFNRAPATAAPTSFSNSELLTDIVGRARQRWLPLLVVLVMTILDWRLHEDIGVSILFGIAGAVEALYFPEIEEKLSQSLQMGSRSAWLRPLLIVVPAALFFLLRGKGEHFDGIGGLSFEEGLLVAIVLIGGTLLLQQVMPNLDDSLQGFYETRDRYLPPPACIAVMVALSALITFGAVHGKLEDIQVLFGQDASKSAFPKVENMLLIVLVNMALGVAFLRPARRY